MLISLDIPPGVKRGGTDMQVSFWDGNYVPSNSVTLTSGSGDKAYTSTYWHALSLT